MHTARIDPTATLLQNGKVLIAGGSNANGALSEDIYASAELYDPATGKFTKTGSMTAARVDQTATLLADGRVLIAGGIGCPDPAHCTGMTASTLQILASAELYDPKTGKFSPTGSMTTPRHLATSTLLPDGRVLVAEGMPGPNQTADLYDPSSGRFARTGKETGFDNANSVLLPTGKVLVTGGDIGDPPTGSIYDEASGQFTSVSFALAPGAAPSAQYSGQPIDHAWPGPAVVLKDGRVLLFEGGNLETYDPTTGACVAAGFISPSSQWLAPTATLLTDGRVLYVGGFLEPDPSTEVITDLLILYDPSARNQTVGSMTTARSDQTVTLLPDGSVLIAGGEDANYKPLASAELFKP